MTIDKTELVEYFGDMVDGFRIRWRYSPTWCDVEVFASIGLYSDGPKFARIGTTSAHDDPTDDLDQAEHYLRGSIKFDACSNFEFDEPGNALHVCGVGSFRQHCALIERIYRRAMELMGREDEWGKP